MLSVIRLHGKCYCRYGPFPNARLAFKMLSIVSMKSLFVFFSGKKYEFSCLVTYFNYKIDTKRTRRNTRREKISMINFYGFVNKSIFTNHFNILFSLRRNIWISQVPKLCLISFLKDIRIPLLFSWEKIYNLFILSLPYLFLVSRLLKCR